MSFNLLDAAKSLFNNELINKAGAYLGETEAAVQHGINAVVPAILGKLTDKASSIAGANTVTEMVQRQHNPGVSVNLASYFTNDGGGLLNKGAGLLDNLFGDKIDEVTTSISAFSGLKNSSVTSLLSMALPALLNLIGKHASASGAGNVSTLLNGQKGNIAAAVPAGLNLKSILGGWSNPVSNISTGAVRHTHTTSASVVEKDSSNLKWLLPLLLLVLLAAAAWYLFGKGCHSTDTTTATGDTVKVNTSSNPTDASVLGKLDSLTGDWFYNEGDTITLTLPNGGGDLRVGKFSTEAKLVNFLTDTNQKIDTVKGNWFEFTNVHFNTGKAGITDASQNQLKNVAAIIKAFNTAQFKLGGYTDSTGTLAVNLKVSEERAKAVEAFLVKDGVSAGSFTGTKGYGPEWPVASNTTPEGRAQNRRVAVNVKAK